MLPEDAPDSFRAAFELARERGEPLVIAFGAAWCGPCRRLKQETLAHEDVLAAARGVRVIEIDVDQHPELARAYGVTSIPDVVFVNSYGTVVDRLRRFEGPALFRERLDRLRASRVGRPFASAGFETVAPSDATAQAMQLPLRVRRQGREVRAIDPDGPAARAGLRAGDVVLSVGGSDLYSQDDLDDLLRAGAPGAAVALSVQRAGRTEREVVELTLAAGAGRQGAEIDWQYANLGQLERALSEARALKKKVLVGLSGAET